MKIEMIDTDKLLPYANNPRKNQAVDKVAASIKEFGFRQPIVVDQDMVIVVGHTRLQAANKLGLKQIPVHIATNLTPKQIAAYRLADNRTQEAEWDNDKLYIELKEIGDLFSGFDRQEINTLFARHDKYQKDQDDIPDPQPTSKTKPGDVFILGNHKVICGDSTNPDIYHKLLANEVIDLCLTDPPYNVKYDQSKNPSMNPNPKNPNQSKKLHKVIANDDMTDQQFTDFLYNAFSPAFRYLKQGGVVYCFHADRSRLQFEQALIKAGIKLTVSLVWVKNCLVFSRLDYQPRHEPILYGWKEGAAHYFADDRTLTSVIDEQTDYSKLPKEQLVKILQSIQTDVLRFDKPTKADLHPTMKPISLLQRLIENSTKPEQLVLDPFGGSGSTVIAAETSNRQSRIIEIDPCYVDVICKRWSDFTGKQAIKQGN